MTREPKRELQRDLTEAATLVDQQRTTRSRTSRRWRG